MKKVAPQGPERYESLRREILENSDKLSKQLKLIAGYTLRHPDDIALENSYVVAQRAGVQPSALVRFAQAFGCEGYTELQAIFRSRIRERTLSLEPSSTKLPDDAGGIAGEVRHFLGELSRTSMNALERLDAPENAERIIRAAEVVLSANTVYLLAQRRSFAITVYLQYLLSHLNLRVHLLDGVGGLLFEQAASVREGDAVIAVAFHTYAPDVVQLAREFKSRNVSIIGLTDGPLSPLVPVGDVVFQIEDASIKGLPPITAMSCLAIALVAGILTVRDERDKVAPREEDAPLAEAPDAGRRRRARKVPPG